MLERPMRSSELLALLRQRKDMSQQKLADATGASRSMIAQLESGERQPSADMLIALSQALFLSKLEQAMLFLAYDKAQADRDSMLPYVVAALHLDPNLLPDQVESLAALLEQRYREETDFIDLERLELHVERCTLQTLEFKHSLVEDERGTYYLTNQLVKSNWWTMRFVPAWESSPTRFEQRGLRNTIQCIKRHFRGTFYIWLITNFPKNKTNARKLIDYEIQNVDHYAPSQASAAQRITFLHQCLDYLEKA